jgi:hypothetical protein
MGDQPLCILIVSSIVVLHHKLHGFWRFVSPEAFLFYKMKWCICSLCLSAQRFALPAGGRDEITLFSRNQLQATQTA